MTNHKIKSVGEWGFLSRILPKLTGPLKSKFIIPPGDDAAVMRATPHLVLSIDGLSEGTHFKSSWSKKIKKQTGLDFGRALGWKLMGASLSDLAAMGDTKNRWAMIYLGCPGETNVDLLMDLFKGVKEAAKNYSCVVVGGDTVRAKEISLVAAVGGELVGKRALPRSGARPGNVLCLTGTVGDASIGLKILMGQLNIKSSRDRNYFIGRFFKLIPLFNEGRVLSKEMGVTSLIDVSDSLLETIEIICRDSSVGAEVEISAVPVSSLYRQNFEINPTLLSGGEDYALLFTATQEAVRNLSKKMKFSVIGEIKKSSSVKFSLQGRPVNTPKYFQQFG